MKHRLKVILIALIAGLQLCTLMALFEQRSQPMFGVVDINTLVSFEARKVVSDYPKNQLSHEKLQQIALRLREGIEAFSDNRKLILLAQAAVWGGDLPDYTDKVIDFIKRRADQP